jgi:hypothetical protein
MMKDQLPYGVQDLDSQVCVDLGPPKKIRCFVRACSRILRPPTRRGGGDVCPEHGLRCHSSGTYSYADVRRNLIVDAELFATKVAGHSFKHETHRFNQENSEDALTWNVFRSLQNAGCLQKLANLVTGLDINEEPQLFLWGLGLTGDTFEPWELLIAARQRFENKLPVKRPLTEPDIALYLPGRYIVLIEAKFTSANPFYASGARKDATSLTKDEMIDIYWDQALTALDRSKARAAERVHYQLWRNLVFAEWMAGIQRDATPAFLGSLTRRGKEQESCREFGLLLNEDYRNRFSHISWEGLLETCLGSSPSLITLAAYIKSKTASLHQAFDLV